MAGTEVTQAGYQALMNANPSFFQGAGYPNSGLRPVDSVSWVDAVSYCQALTAAEFAARRVPPGYEYRLPTEAEWEYCCRAGTLTAWNTGAGLSTTQANHANAVGSTSVVGSYAANPWGLRDMHGNIVEWCADSWDGSANYPSSTVVNPFIGFGPQRVVRGGHWRDLSNECRSTYRGLVPPETRVNFIGFRVVLAPTLP